MQPLRIRIEPLVPGHAELLFDDLRDPALYTFIPDEPPASLADLIEQYERWNAGPPGERGEIWCNWVMVDVSDGRPIGTLQATLHADGHATIAYTVVARRWREGLAREGVGWLLSHLAERGVPLVEARVDTRNVASIRLLEVLGFRRVQTLVGVDHFKGSPSDEHVYQR